jgi:putative hemolysin
LNKIDLSAAIRQSDSPFLKNLPAFVIGWLRKLICEDRLNALLEKYGHLDAMRFREGIIGELGLKLHIHGRENLTDSGRCLFVANHPFGVIDGLTLTHLVQQKYGDFRSIGNDAWKFVPPLFPHILVVNVYGMSGRKALQKLEETLQSQVPITHFPAGEVSRIYDGKIQDCLWHKSLIAMAVKHNRPIVPVYFEGKNSKWFYRLFRLRKMLGISLNLELALLPREFLGAQNQTITAHIRPPVDPEIFTDKYSEHEWAQHLKRYTLTGNMTT